MILVHPEAVAEARRARRRYARLDPAVGRRFAVAYDDVIDRITQTPDRWPAYPHASGHYRWCRFRRFPFAGIYEVFPQVVHARYRARSSGARLLVDAQVSNQRHRS